MKALAALIALVSFTFSVLAMAAGFHALGGVAITSTSMAGSYNVRYNTAIAGQPYITAEGYVNQSVYFIAQDSAGTVFYCYVPPSSPIYQGAVDIKNTVRNGSWLYVTKFPQSAECQYVYSRQSSYFLD